MSNSLWLGIVRILTIRQGPLNVTDAAVQDVGVLSADPQVQPCKSSQASPLP
jgi:hypothetical protein